LNEVEGATVVVDASLALAWCFPDETSDYADAVLVALEGWTVLVPSIWGLEIANAVLVGERRQRLTQTEIKQFTRLLESLSLLQDTRGVTTQVSDVLPLARLHGLSAYDAAYLEVAIRHGVPLATLDGRLQSAAKVAGVTLFEGKSSG
jgi:predicted nucleic acid-binding protein